MEAFFPHRLWVDVYGSYFLSFEIRIVFFQRTVSQICSLSYLKHMSLVQTAYTCGPHKQEMSPSQLRTTSYSLGCHSGFLGEESPVI